MDDTRMAKEKALCEKAAKIIKRRRNTESRLLSAMLEQAAGSCDDGSYDSMDEPGCTQNLVELAQAIVRADQRKRSGS